MLSHSAGVAPSPAVFRHFFALSAFGKNKQYCFRSRVAVGLLFGRLNAKLSGWKEEFFFLSSSAPWPCPVQWGVPSRSATFEPALTGEEMDVAAKLLRVGGGSPIDLTTYLCERNMVAAKIIRAPSPPTPQGGLLNTPARSTTRAVKVKSEPDSDVAMCRLVRRRHSTANEVVFSLGYALELEDRLREADALRAELRKVKAELAETKATAARGAGVRRIQVSRAP
ncbi:hypothetical protein ACQ4PT_011099 [Festuca glaucescens]